MVVRCVQPTHLLELVAFPACLDGSLMSCKDATAAVPQGTAAMQLGFSFVSGGV
jgi:hypothetical protein